MLLSFVLFIIGITLYQERKTERALEALRDLSSPRALVIRDGVEKRVAGREVVRGDIVVIAEGDRVPADCFLLWNINLSVDESMLTGECVPVRKTTGTTEEADNFKGTTPGGEDLPMIYSGTMLVGGQGAAKVLQTGENTEIGKIGKSLKSLKTEKTPLELETRGLVLKMAAVGAVMCILLIVMYGILVGDWIRAVLIGMALAMALLPEEFPVVLTVFLALGAWRISKSNVLTRRPQVIETLGSATVLCVDKTGTLTMNCMTVNALHDFQSRSTFVFPAEGLPKGQIPEIYHGVVEFAVLASQADPFDPMDKALKKLTDDRLVDGSHVHQTWALVKEYPLSKELLSISRVYKSSATEDFVIAAKGAPEAIGDLCHLGGADTERLRAAVEDMASQGHRVLGVARARLQATKQLPTIQHDYDFEMLGLTGFLDPVRPLVDESVAACKTASIRVCMITGDYPSTARNIGRQIGLPSDVVLTGKDLAEMPADELKQRISTCNIFARVVPEQKLKIVTALKANREIVAMTGDGVNDAPALKAAHIGIAMGARGTDVAREAASLVLTDDDFSSIVRAIRLGRRIYANLCKAFAYIVCIHVPLAGMTLIPVFFGWKEVFYPVHIVFMELVIDPSCSIVFECEPEEPYVMSTPPRDINKKMMSLGGFFLSFMQGGMLLMAGLLTFWYAHDISQRPDEESNALCFGTVVFGNLGLILVNRSWESSCCWALSRTNKALYVVMCTSVSALFLVIYTPFLQDLFVFKPLGVWDVAQMVAVGVGSVMWFEVFKFLRVHVFASKEAVSSEDIEMEATVS